MNPPGRTSGGILWVRTTGGIFLVAPPADSSSGATYLEIMSIVRPIQRFPPVVRPTRKFPPWCDLQRRDIKLGIHLSLSPSRGVLSWLEMARLVKHKWAIARWRLTFMDRLPVSVGRYIDVNIDISIFLKYRQHQCILKETSLFFRYFLAIISNSSVKIS